MRHFKDIITKWLPLISWLVVIFMVSHQPKNTIPDYGTWDFLVKKGGHMFAYGVLAILVRRLGVHDAGAFGFVLVYAVSDEFHQRFIPGRTGTALDVIIDLLGATLALTIIRLLPQRLYAVLLDQTDGIDEQSPRGA